MRAWICPLTQVISLLCCTNVYMLTVCCSICIIHRGALGTRLAKLDAKERTYDALILAAAGLIRMGWKERIQQVCTPLDCPRVCFDS
jgi:Porphobilinogen deaminase, dipyromethane cofactor binding domain